MSTAPRDKASRGVSRLGLLLVLTPLLLLLIAGLSSLVWWQYFKSTPAYSLSLLVDAAQRNDPVAFDEAFDTKVVVEHFLSDAANRMTGSTTLGDTVMQRVQPVSGPVSEAVKPIVRERLQKKINELGPAANLPFFLKALAIRLGTNVSQNDEKATVVIEHNNQHLELWLAPTEHRWKVVAVKDDELAEQVLANIKAKLRKSQLPVAVPKGLTLPDLEKLIP